MRLEHEVDDSKQDLLLANIGKYRQILTVNCRFSVNGL